MSNLQELDAAFRASKSVGEMMETFKLILCFSGVKQSDLDFYCGSIMNQLLTSQSGNAYQLYSFAVTALTITHARKIPCFEFPFNDDINTTTNTVTHTHGSPFFIAAVQYVLGSSCFSLMRFDESLRILGWALDNLTELDNDDNNRCPRNCVWNILAATQQLLCIIKVDRGKPGEAAVHARKALKFKELAIKEGSIEIGHAYVQVYEAYVAAKDAEEALPFCLKAVEIFSNSQGVDPQKVVMLRVDLEVLYLVVENYEAAAEQNQLRTSVVMDSYGFLDAEFKFGNRLMHFGMCKEAIGVLRAVASRADTEKGRRLKSFVNMAWASCILKKINDAKEHIRAAERIIESNDIGDPIFVGHTLLDLSKLYEKMDDLDSAISVVRRVFEMNLVESVEKSKNLNLLATSSSRFFSLMSMSLAGGVKQETSYLRDVVDKLEKSFGQGHIQVAYGYANFGAVLINAGQEDQAVKLIEDAKDIMNVALGPHHLDSLKTRHNLSQIYAKLGRYTEAIEIEAKVIEGTDGLEPTEQQFIDEAVNLLNDMKERKKATERNEAKS